MKLAFCIVAIICFALSALPLALNYNFVPLGLAFLAAAECL